MPSEKGFLYLCWNCRAKLPFIKPPMCEVCGSASMGDGENFICYKCQTYRPWFDQARSLLHYRGDVRKLTQDFKYRSALWLRHDFYLLLQAGYAAYYQSLDIDLVAYVPLFAAKERQRAYNQAKILAKGLLPCLPGCVLSDLLKRVRASETQTHLTAKQRIANVKNVFIVKKAEKVQRRKILLLDDVMTTGATVNECARVLKKAGAAKVYVLTLARG